MSAIFGVTFHIGRISEVLTGRGGGEGGGGGREQHEAAALILK